MRKDKASKKSGEEVIVKSNTTDDSELKLKIEALLFSAGKRVELEFISNVVAQANINLIKKALLDLKKDYEERDSSLMIVEDGSSWKIIVKEKYAPIVRKIVADTELSKTVMETLAVIAWKSPVLQSEVIRIRTNKAYDHIEELINTGFVTKEKKGRSFILKITEKFYNYFDVEGKEDIRNVFSKIKEKPVQRKVDEFKADGQKKLGSLDVVNASPDTEKTVKEAESDMGKIKIGPLEIYDENDEENKEGKTSVAKTDSFSQDVRKEVEEARKLEEEELKAKTKRIVDELLKEDKPKKEKKDKDADSKK